MRFLLTLSLLLSVIIATAQTTAGTFTLTEIQAADLPYRIQKLGPWGISPDEAAPIFYYSFMHTGAGIQVDRGAMKSGGKDPVTVEALGKVNLDPVTGAPGKSSLQWIAPEGTGSNINIFLNPISGAKALTTKPLAKKGTILSYEAYEALTDPAVAGGFYKLPAYKSAAAEAVKLTESYATTSIYVGLAGGIQTITTSNFTLKPEEKRGKSLLGNPNYKMKASFAKGTAKKVFKETEMSFKVMTDGNIPQLADPSTGNVVIFGGVKYKKDKSKDGSHYREFFLMGSDTEGNLTGQEKIETDESLVLTQAYPIGGQEIAPGIRQSSLALFLAEGGADEGETADLSLRHAFIVDINTARIISQNNVNLPEGKHVVVGTETDTDGNTVLLNYSVKSGQITPLTLTKGGLVLGEARISGNLDLLTNLSTENLKLRTISSFDLADGRTMLLKKLADAYLTTYVSADGKRMETKALMKAITLQPIARKGDRILFAAKDNFLELDLADGSTKSTKIPVALPAGEMMFFSERFSTLYAMLPAKASTKVQLLTYRFE